MDTSELIVHIVVFVSMVLGSIIYYTWGGDTLFCCIVVFGFIGLCNSRYD